MKELFRSENCLTKLDWVEIGGFLKAIIDGAGFGYMEEHSQQWATNSSNTEELWTRAVEVGILWSFLRESNLRLHATQLTLCLLRAAIYAEANKKISVEESFEFIEFVEKALYDDAKELLDWFASVPEDDRLNALVRISGTELVEFSVRTLLLLQTISLAVLNNSLTKAELEIAGKLLTLAMEIEALTKPISDNFATTVMTIALASTRLKLDTQSWLRRIGKWVCDSYDEGNPGLALAGSTPEEEVWRTCGAPLDMDEYQVQSNSMLAAALLDLCSVLRFAELYNDASADFRTLDINPVKKIPEKLPDELLSGKQACYMPPHKDYSESWQGIDGWINAGSQKRADEDRFFIDNIRGWVSIALSVTLRDRWWLKGVRIMSGVDESTDLVHTTNS